MNRIFILLFPFIIVSCSSALTYNQAVDKNQDKYESSDMRSDAQFMVESKSFSMLEQALGKLAAERGYAAAIQLYGSKIAQDHERMNRGIDDLASDLGIVVPSEMSTGHRQKYEQVKQASRQQFDKVFIKTIENIYESHIDLFKMLATNATNDDLRAFAAKNLSLLRQNEEQADQLQGELL